MTRLTEHGRRIRRNLALASVLAAAITAMLALGIVLRDSRVIDGPAGDSTVTASRGAAALSRLLDIRGIDVQRSGGPLDRVDRLSTIVLIEPGLLSDVMGLRAGELSAHLDRGGMVVLGGNVSDEVVRQLSGRPYETVAADDERAVIDVGFVTGSLVGEGSRRAVADVEQWMVLAGEPRLTSKMPRTREVLQIRHEFGNVFLGGWDKASIARI